jgi:hypothetical protein
MSRAQIITTPNVAYNVNIPGLAPGAFRHDDHRIEYNSQQWKVEILDPLTRAGYAIVEQDLEPGVSSCTVSWRRSLNLCAHHTAFTQASLIRRASS